MNVNKKSPTFVLLAVLIPLAMAGVLALSGGARGVSPDQPTARWMERPCKYEDSPNCFWDAGTRGDGNGHSFYTHTINGSVCLMYTQPAYAKEHDRCTPRNARTTTTDLDGDGVRG